MSSHKDEKSSRKGVPVRASDLPSLIYGMTFLRDYFYMVFHFLGFVHDSAPLT